MQTSDTYSIGDPPAPLPAMVEGTRAELRSLCDHMTADNYRDQIAEICRVARLWLHADVWRRAKEALEIDDGNDTPE